MRGAGRAFAPGFQATALKACFSCPRAGNSARPLVRNPPFPLHFPHYVYHASYVCSIIRANSPFPRFFSRKSYQWRLRFAYTAGDEGAAARLAWNRMPRKRPQEGRTAATPERRGAIKAKQSEGRPGPPDAEARPLAGPTTHGPERYSTSARGTRGARAKPIGRRRGPRTRRSPRRGQAGPQGPVWARRGFAGGQGQQQPRPPPNGRRAGTADIPEFP